MKTALTIAGFDPSGGAGLQADIKTFHAHGVHGFSALTAITVQDTKKVHKVYGISPQAVYDQIICLFKDADINAVKIGMLGNKEIIDAVADALSKVNRPTVVLDPVMVSTTGFSLLEAGSLKRFINKLFPVSDIITPNIREAEILTAKKIKTIEDMEKSAGDIFKMWISRVVIKGGQLCHGSEVDILHDGKIYKKIKSPWVKVGEVHGTGCTLSSALTANMALGKNFFKAALDAKTYITEAFEHVVSPGKGSRQFNHFYNYSDALI